ncbi:hypothetical protein Geob_1309 [Geotalea daltonii FRC-32]|uniref:Uncharacterized protein n=1 Tax=Geotalea daltonii (strain DSM 22248 / JCM 15807 / FRC-32) TaxID=316067 RepID=B9M4E3_GEODF|nr:hypothetical protein [Geotalea daltonii]ACM19669.1 hypothetical protein Geob_1309 [Geotalea daltonii FRC-32]
MINVLLIADQVRLEQIVISAAKACNANVHHIVSLNIPEEVKSGSPAVIFIQNRLSGLSGDILARHLRTFFSSEAGSVILLSADNSDSPQALKFVDDCIDLNQSDAEVALRVTEALNNHMCKSGSNTPDMAISGGPGAPAPVTEVTDRVSLSGDQISLQQKATVDSPFLDKLEGALTDLEPFPIQDRTPPPSESHYAERAGDFVIEEETPRQRVWFYLGISIVFAASLYFFIGGKLQVNRKPSTTSATATIPRTEAGPGMTRLPAFIPTSRPDLAYGKEHPGWERYLDSSNEFKVFRKNGVISALQIIDRSAKGLSGSFVRNVLHESAAAVSYSITSTEVKGNYIIEKGVTDKASVIVYRRRSDRQMKAFVLYFQ